MADYKLPELPSDDELGITKEDRERYGDDASGRGEQVGLSKEELLALLGDEPAKPGARDPKKKDAKSPQSAKAPPGDTGGAPAPAARSGRRGPLTLALLVLMVALSSSRAALPRAVPANAADTAFSSGRAMGTVVEIARAPHPTGSPEHTRVRDYLVDRMRSLGLEPEVQTATSVIERGTAARAATVRNVTARIPGTASTGAVLITAHYDSREIAPGAGDDASGVATVLEAVRALRAGAPLRNDVIVLLTDSEELGLLGARAFVDGHPWLDDVAIVLSFEMRGAGGASIMFETAPENGWVVRALSELDPRPFANSLALEVYERLPNDTDFTPFVEAGKQGLNFAAIGRGHVYHQSTDTPENLSEATLQHHGLRALAALRWFGAADLSAVTAPNVVYFSVPLLGLVVYDGSWVLPIAGGLAVGLALLVLFALRARARAVGILAGLGVAVLAGALSYGVGVALLRWSAPFHPEAGSLSAALYHREGWYVISLATAVFLVVVGLHALAGRWLRSEEQFIGALVVPAGLALWASFAAPLGAMNVQWPVLAATLAGLVLLALRARAAGWPGWASAVLLAVPVVVLLAPAIELLWITLSFAQAPVLGVLIAGALWLCLPLLGFLRQPNAWWAPLSALVAAGASFALGNLAASPSAERPAPSTLLYAYEHGERSGLWVTDPAADPVSDSVAIAWASVPTGARFTEARDLSDFGLPGERPVADAPTFAAAPPTVVVLSDSIVGGARHLQLGVRSQVGAEMMAFQVDRRGGVRALAVNGRALAGSDSLLWVEHWGVPDSLVTLDLVTGALAPVGVHIVEHLLRPGEVVVADVFRRPPQLAPDVAAESDRAVFRSSVDALLAAAPPPSAQMAADSVAAPVAGTPGPPGL
jgi:hypothetical protein